MKKHIIIFVAVVVLIGAAAFIWCKRGNNGWYSNIYLTYNNAKHGFSFQYHPDWYLLGDADSDIIQISNKENDTADGGAPLGARIEVMALENYENLALAEWVDQLNLNRPNQDTLGAEEINVDGQKAIRQMLMPPEGPVEQGAPIGIYLAKENYIILINYLGREPDYSDNIKVWQHFLASFTFD